MDQRTRDGRTTVVAVTFALGALFTVTGLLLEVTRGTGWLIAVLGVVLMVVGYVRRTRT